MTKPRIQLGLIIILAVFAVSLLVAQSASPDLPPFFAIKRVQEKAFLTFKTNPAARVDYMSSLLEARLQELQNLVKHQSYGYVLPAASRYSTLAGQITELVSSNHLTDKVDTIKNQFLNHQKILDALYVAYPKDIPDNWEWKYIQDDFNYLGLYLNQLKEIK